jgi:hypothetical protein
MGREAAHWVLELSEEEGRAVEALFDALDVERVPEGPARRDFVLRDPYRFWIDLRIHDEPLRLEVRVALTNDTWAIRAPLERVLIALEPTLGERPFRDEDGREVATFGADGWSRELEDDYAKLRDAFIARVGDFNAPISADHVYMYVHQTRWNRDNDDELAWHREREIAQLEESWEADLPPDAELPTPEVPGADPRSEADEGSAPRSERDDRT